MNIIEAVKAAKAGKKIRFPDCIDAIVYRPGVLYDFVWLSDPNRPVIFLAGHFEMSNWEAVPNTCPTCGREQ